MPVSTRQIDDYFPSELLTRFGKTVADAATAVRDAVERYVAILKAFEPSVLERPVGPGKWTPVGFTEHLYLVTTIASNDIDRVLGGDEAVRHERGLLDGAGNLIVTVPGATPGPARPVDEVVSDLRASTEGLISRVRAAVSSGHGDVVVHVNPYFGELTPLGCLQLAATHAHHHRKRHLVPLAGGQPVPGRR